LPNNGHAVTAHFCNFQIISVRTAISFSKETPFAFLRQLFLPLTIESSCVCFEHTMGVARGIKGAMNPTRFVAYLLVLCFERRYLKQNTVARLKSSILPPPNVWADYATGVWHCIRAGVKLRIACSSQYYVQPAARMQPN